MKIDLKESLNELDIISDNRYDLYNIYLSKNPSIGTKKKLAEAIYKNKSPKEIALILKEDWDDAAWHDTADQEQVDQPDYFPDGEEESEWTEMDSKSVRDSDGFLTDYTWYWRNNNGEDQHVFVFGDSDLYGPEDGYFDWECDSLEEAQEWFDSYVGPGDEEDWMDESLSEDVSKEWKPNLNFKHIKDVLEKALSRGKYVNNEREEVKAALDLCDKKQKYTPEQRKYIKDSHEKMWRMNRKTESLKEDTSKETIKWKITYDKGRPGGEEEVVEFPTYKEAKKYAADHAKGWGFEVKKIEESLDESVDDIHNDFEIGRKYWNRLNLDIDFDSALDKWNKSSELAEPDTWYSKPLYSEEAWNDMVSMFSNMDESLNEKMVKVEPSDKELNQVINVLTKYGFKLDDNYKPGRGLFGSYHIQVINPDLDYIDFDQLVADVGPLGDALDNLSLDINMPITYSFGSNDDNVITGGVDIHVGYKDDGIDESLKEDLNLDDFMEPVDQVGKAKIYYDSNKRTYFTPSLDLDFETLDQAKDFIGAPLYMGESLKEDFIISPEKEYTSKSGHKILIKDVIPYVSEYDGTAHLEIKYDYKLNGSDEWKSSKCNQYDLFKMLTESSNNESLKEDWFDDMIKDGKKYTIFGESSKGGLKQFYTDNPKIAIKKWFDFQKNCPYNVYISTVLKSDALELLKNASEDYLTSLYSKYGSPYKLEYLIDSVKTQIDNGCRGFYEKYGDQIEPFSVG